MPKKTRKTATEGRQYTFEEVERLLNNSKTAYREHRLQMFKKMLSAVVVFYVVLLICGTAIYAVYKLLEDRPLLISRFDEMRDPVSPRIGYCRDGKGDNCNPIYDTTDFTRSIDEEILCRRVADIDVSLTEVKIPCDIIEEFFRHPQSCGTNDFENVQGNGAERRMSCSPLLRFRVAMRNGVVVEAALPRWGQRVILSRTANAVDVPVNEISCLRGALFGAAYLEDVKLNMSRFGESKFLGGLVAKSADECLTDVDARKLWYFIVAHAEATRFDWGAVVRVLTFGVWNEYHPRLSLLITLVLVAGAVVIRKKLL